MPRAPPYSSSHPLSKHVLGLALEIDDARYGAVVFPDGLIKLDTHPDAHLELNLASEANNSFVLPANNDNIPDVWEWCLCDIALR